jgi:signal transduction histidine kinase
LGFKLIVLVGVLALLFDFFFEFMLLLMPLSMAYLLMVAGFAVRMTLIQGKEGGWVLLATIFGFSGVIGTALSLSGVVSGGTVLLYSYTIGTLGSILVFQVILNRRYQQIEQEHVSLRLAKNHAEKLILHEKEQKEQKAQFLSMLTHELKTPLAVIRLGLSQALPSKKSRGHMMQAIRDMTKVIDRCAILEKVDDTVEVRLQKCNISSLLNDMLFSSIHSTRIKWIGPDREAVINTDPDWLKVILSNLLDNALKYSPDQTLVTIQVYQQSQTWCIAFTNLTTEDSPDPDKLFDKYYRAKSAHKHTGSGLGLYLVKCLVDKLNATIDYHVKPQLVADLNVKKVEFVLCIPMS